MKIELYTKDEQGKAEKVDSYLGSLPVKGATVLSEKGILYEILEYAMEYDRDKNFVGCSAEVKKFKNKI
jgi:hypothetical protein